MNYDVQLLGKPLQLLGPGLLILLKESPVS